MTKIKLKRRPIKEKSNKKSFNPKKQVVKWITDELVQGDWKKIKAKKEIWRVARK